ncbi:MULTISPECIES: hypothetical protein [unclassified Paenibacillus]|uniref:hypothetical protein n=1 Tax=unclassified Paenibacillus TaxID=185978 RepID=UPI00020D74CD|nr:MULTISPECIES: hypothetical protein [unclassified Paenibacillus]EGL13368.1 hypothetical protein HMPREF9413_4903 [Paenibacillus sp. HGF7]EPD81935.1 hypothetical protein HMPREF1207_03761 [Paenibacillus sp. HGH0039]
MKKFSSIFLIVLGVMIILATSNPLYLMYKEKKIQHSLNTTYTITQHDVTENSLEINNNNIKVIDTPKDDFIHVEILLNGEKLPGSTDVAPAKDGNYTRGVWVNVLTIHKNEESNNKNDWVAIVQTMKDQASWTICYIDNQQKMTAKHVTNENPSNDPLDIYLIKNSGAPMIGYYSDINYASGNPLATVIPIAIAITGGILLLIGLLTIPRRQKK